MSDFNIDYLIYGLLAAVLSLASLKIKQLRRQIERDMSSDPPPRCMNCEFYKAAKAEFKHERETTAKHTIKPLP